jgi:hypothetical protein
VLLLHYATVVTDTGVSRWCSSAITVFPRGTVAWGEPVVLAGAVGFAAAAAAAAVLNIVIFSVAVSQEPGVKLTCCCDLSSTVLLAVRAFRQCCVL